MKDINFPKVLFFLLFLCAEHGTAFSVARPWRSWNSMGVSSFNPLKYHRFYETKLLSANTPHDTVEKISPLYNNLLVKVTEIPSKTTGGIFLPDSAKKRPAEGTVSAAGPGRTNLETGFTAPMAVAVGDSVVYGKYDGSEFKHNGINHQIVKDDDILLKFRGGANPTLANVECVHDRVLITGKKHNGTSASGLFAVQSKDNEGSGMASEEGVVVKVGPGLMSASGKLLKMPVAQGF
jgi:chaperonin GroES